MLKSQPTRPMLRRRVEAAPMRLIKTLIFTAVVAVSGVAQAADEYPAKPVRIIVPFEPGGINDIATRLFAQHLSERLGKQFISEYKSGAGGMVGTDYVAHQPPDGYTIAVISV